MSHKDDLYDLIHSLSKSEKRHFKLHLPYTEQQHYIQLFDVLNAIPSYDKEEIARRIAAQPWADNVVALRNYLYQLLLKTLRQLHETQSVDAQIGVFLHNAQLFRKRYQVQRSRQQLEKGKRLAVFYEKYSLLLKLLEEERQLLDIAYYNDDEHLTQTLENEREMGVCLAQLQRIQQYRSRLSQVRSLGQRLFEKQETDVLAELEQLQQHPDLQQPPETTSMVALHYFYSARLQLLFYLRQYDLYQQDSEAYAALWAAADPAIAAEYPAFYQSAQYNVLIYRLYKGDESGFDRSIGEMRKLLDLSAFQELHPLIFVRLLGLELHRYSARGQFVEALAHIERSLPLFRQYSDKCPARDAVSTAFVIGRCYFYAHQFGKAADWFQDLVERFGDSRREDILLVARALQVVAAAESQQIPLLEPLSRSALRFVRQRRNLYQIPGLVIQYIGKLTSVISPQSRQELFKELKQKTEELLNNPLEKSSLQLFDFRIWMDSHLQRKTMEEVMER